MPATLIVQHQVADYDAWRPVFDDHGTTRKEYGCSAERVYRAADDPNAICVVMTYPSRHEIEGFAADPSLKEAMERGGVVSAPTITVAD
jgi:hypothetical protein